MKIKFKSILAAICLILTFFVARIVAQENVPDSVPIEPLAIEILETSDLNQTVSILRRLVVPVKGSCTGELDLPFNLSKEDYIYVVRQILSKDLHILDETLKPDVWHRLTHLIELYQMNEFAQLLTAYLKDSSMSVQAQVISTLRKLQANKFDAEVAAMLDSPHKYVQRLSLETLIDFRSKKAVLPLVKILNDSSENERYWAMLQLVEINATEAAPRIAQHLQDSMPHLRYWALDSLVKLNARSEAKKIWQLVNSNQTNQTEGYAVAALLYFEQTDVVNTALNKLKKVSESENWLDEPMFEFLIKLKPRILIAPMISLVESSEKHLAGEADARFRQHLLGLLCKFEAREAIPVFRKNLYGKRYLNTEIVNVLGELRATDATDDLMEMLGKFSYELGNTSNEAYATAHAAVALAKIGDPKTFPKLLELAMIAKFPYRSEVISEMNRSLDAQLWEKVKMSVTGVDFKSIKENAENFSRESGIQIILEYDPVKDKFRHAPADGTYPQTRAGRAEPLLGYLIQIVGNIDHGTRPRRFTFIFDNGQIRILSVEKAVEWWKQNALVKENQRAANFVGATTAFDSGL